MAGVAVVVYNLVNQNLMPADTTNNVLAIEFAGATPTEGEFNTLADLMPQLFTSTAGGNTDAIGEYLSPEIPTTADAHTVEVYWTTDLDGSTPLGSPVASETFTMPSKLSAQPLPEEVAAVISFHGDLTNIPVTQTNPSPPPATIRPQQRRRGRIFIGPLNISAGSVVGGDFRPSPALRTDFGLAFVHLADEVAANTAGEVAVWSRADAATYPVVAGYVDDAWDTQRRRGLAPTTRTSFTI